MRKLQNVHHNLSVAELVKKAIKNKEVVTSKTGAVVVYTGKYTGRSPKDRFIVDDFRVHDQIDWGLINMPMSEKHFEGLYKKINKFLSDQKDIYIYDGYVCADEQYKVHVRVISQYAYQSLFIQHLLRRPTSAELKKHTPALTVLCAPSCFADPKIDGTNSEVFIALNLSEMVVLIGGTKYAGEIKKSIFAVMNYLLPKKKVLPMHSSANIGEDGTTALFFGLSGTGKTTLSADERRMLIGDDEHGWSKNGIFNFEGGCYAKCIDLKKESEPLIWNAIKHGALIENVKVLSDGSLDFADKSITENTRAAYPLEYIERAVLSGIGAHPKTIIFLTADAWGVLPPIAKLETNAAIYHFLSGYTSKLAGTERGVITPIPTFSAYFGAPFMPLKPIVYANLLKYYLDKHKSTVYLVNTGWVGGEYGVGKRIGIKDTRTIVRAALDGNITGSFRKDKIFNLYVPTNISGIKSDIMNPRHQWSDKNDYDNKARKLASLFTENFARFKDIPKEIINSGPTL